jgi:TRAP-type C4-dicarboxylate transport system permease small subunit
MQSWNVFLGIIAVFSLNGNICLAILRYRTKERGLGQALLENFKWLPMLSIFFGGLSFHLNIALLAHMFSIDMQWGATSKDKTESNFFQEIPKIANSFKWMYLVLIPLIGMMIYFGLYAPLAYRINEVIAIIPMAVMIGSHTLLPFVLNPSVMVFSY